MKIRAMLFATLWSREFSAPELFQPGSCGEARE